MVVREHDATRAVAAWRAWLGAQRGGGWIGSAVVMLLVVAAAAAYGPARWATRIDPVEALLSD